MEDPELYLGLIRTAMTWVTTPRKMIEDFYFGSVIPSTIKHIFDNCHCSLYTINDRTYKCNIINGILRNIADAHHNYIINRLTDDVKDRLLRDLNICLHDPSLLESTIHDIDRIILRNIRYGFIKTQDTYKLVIVQETEDLAMSSFDLMDNFKFRPSSKVFILGDHYDFGDFILSLSQLRLVDANDQPIIYGKVNNLDFRFASKLQYLGKFIV